MLIDSLLLDYPLRHYFDVTRLVLDYLFIRVSKLTLLSIKMPNPGSFLGARLEFLQTQRRLYAVAVIANFRSTCVADIQHRYFKRFPIEHKHDVDPTPEFLASVNDDEANAEVVVPDPSALSPEEFETAEQLFKEHQKLVIFRKQVS